MRSRFCVSPRGLAGYTAVLALFQQSQTGQTGSDANGNTLPVTGPKSALHHIALSLPFEEQDAVMRWYERIGQPYRVELFGWIGWRGIFTQDPEGNTVELVAYDAAMLDAPTE